MNRTTYTARWILPVSQPPLPHGTITVAGETIESVNPHGERTADIDLGNAAIIPGLVNAHTHLDLSGARGLIPPGDPEHFTDWLLGVIAWRRSRTPEQMQTDIQDGLAESLRYGTTLIGDITASGDSWNALNAGLLRSRAFYEFLGLSQERAFATYQTLLQWKPIISKGDQCLQGVSPHAPYSVRYEFFRSLAANGWPLAIHLAESPAEMELIASKTGPFERFLRSLNVWEPDGIIESFDWLLWRTCRSPSVLLVHANYLPLESEIWPNQSIVFCPRTHAAFGHPRHPFPHFLARGVNVALGTDSLASNPDLDLLAEAKSVRDRYPDVPGETILRMATINGAKALGFADQCGSLEAGKSADFVVLPLANEDGEPHDLAFASQGPRQTLYRGQWR